MKSAIFYQVKKDKTVKKALNHKYSWLNISTLDPRVSLSLNFFYVQ